MPSQITLKAAGLYTSPNFLETPDGALSDATNVIIKRNNIVESRRGFRLYGTPALSSIKQLIVYKDRILRHFSNLLAFDTQVENSIGQSIFNTFAGNYSEVSPGLRIKSIESNGNLYFTTSDGIKKISASSADQFTTASGFITNAGGVKAINGSARINLVLGNTTGFLPEDSAVAYRIVWGTRDANNNTILGTPSERIIVYNPLLGLLIPDFNNVLGALDNITDNTTTARIGDGDYIATLALDIDSSATAVQTALINLATKIDEDILYATDGGGSPLAISTATITASVATITFSSGDPTTFFQAGSKIFLSGFVVTGTGSINGAQTITGVTSSTLTFNTSAVGTVAVTSTSIVSYEYRNTIANVIFNGATFDLNTLIITNPTTNDQLNVLQNALDQIITRLQSEPTTVITLANQNAYIIELDITTTTTVILTINIPQDITSDYFLQIYRSDIAIATGTTVLSDLVPNDEMQLDYEAFPTAAELAARQMVVEDIVVDEFLGANLYTNPSTGEGILQANDIPPIAKDINRFKNVIFYANTKTRHRLNLNLLGIQNFKAGNISDVTATNPTFVTTDAPHGLATGQIVYVNGSGVTEIDGSFWSVTVASVSSFSIPVSSSSSSSVGYWTNAAISVITGNSAENYLFIKGMAEQRTVTTDSFLNTTDAGYYTLYNAKNYKSYYVWQDKTGSTPDPAPMGFDEGIRVNISSSVTAIDVAKKNRDAVVALAGFDFSAEIIGASTNSIVFTNTSDGIATDSMLVNLSNGWSVTTNAQGRGENAPNHEILLSSAVSPAQAVDETSRSLLNVVNQNTAEQIYAYYLSGLADVPGKFLLEGRSLSTSEFCVLANNFDTGNSFDPPITPEPDLTLTNSATNPTVITEAGHGLVSGDRVLIAFSNSSPNIDGNHLVTFLSTSTFSVPINVITAGTTGAMIKESLGVCSENEEKPNRIYYSKFQQPEAVPILNFFDVGSENQEILRIFPIRDSLFVFKEDGVFRISGESAPFNLALFDSSCTLKAADSLGLLDNTIFGWTDHGIQTITEQGVDSVVEGKIDQDLLRLSSSNFPNFSTLTWGTGYHSDNSYTVYTNSSATDETATIGYRWDNITKSWTTIDKPTTCGLINPADDKFYMGAGDVSFIEQERKSFDRTDYAEREVSTALIADNFLNNGASIKLPTVTNINVGDVLFQSQTVTVYNFNNLLDNLDADGGIASVPIQTISTGLTPTVITKNLSFLPAAVNTGTDTITIAGHGFFNNKKVRFVSSGTLPAPLVANTYYFITNITANTFQLSEIASGPVIDLTSSGSGTHTIFQYHGLNAGDVVTLQATNTDPIIDGSYTVDSVTNGYTYSITVPTLIETSGNQGTSRYSYSQNKAITGGQDLRVSLLDLASKLDADPGTGLINYFENIDQKSGSIVNISAANPTVLSLKSSTFAPADVNTGTDTITIASHGYTDGQAVTFTSSGTLPGGITLAETYYILNATLSDFQLSVLPGGFVLDITSVGSGVHSILLSHGLANGRVVAITSTNSTPTIDGTYDITVIDANKFSVPKSVIISGNSGTFSTQPSDFDDLKACFNSIVNNLNLDPNVISTNFPLITENTDFEALITSVNVFTDEVGLAPSINFVEGPMTVFNAIETTYTYNPQTMGDALGFKHLTEATMMFINKAFTSATLSMSSDLLPEFINIPFAGDGNGIFGNVVPFGSEFFGGGSHGAPFRTYVPRDVQRCRYVIIKFTHRIAREHYSILGITVTGKTGISPRAYR